MSSRLAAALLALLLAAAPALAGKAKAPKVPPCAGAQYWCALSTSLRGFAGGAYTPILTSGDAVTVFGNALDSKHAGWWARQSGTWSRGVGPAELLIGKPQVYDEPCQTNGGSWPNGYCVRTSAVQRSGSGCVAMLTVGNGYPTTDSYRPAWATSDDCASWLYRGRILIEGSFAGFGQTDSQAMIVNEAAPASPDHGRPLANRYVIFLNYQNLEGRTHNLIAVYSADGVSWWRGRDAFGKLIDYWPRDPLAFPSAALTPYGIEIIAGNTWPAERHIHIKSCDFAGFVVVEEAARTITGSFGKGTNLAYDAGDDTLHAFSGGVHWRAPAGLWGGC